MLKQVGHKIVGDFVKIDNITKDWSQVAIHPVVYYRKEQRIEEALNAIKGLYAELDTGRDVYIRFQTEEDANTFLENIDT